MGRRVLVLSSIVAAALAALPLLAQEGHPLSGTWHGEWHPAPGQQTSIVAYMKWDNKAIIGAINPGPRSMPLKSVSLDASLWTVHFEADGKDQAGNAVHVSAEGKMEDIGSYHRTISGTWTQGGVKGDFKIRRD